MRQVPRDVATPLVRWKVVAMGPRRTGGGGGDAHGTDDGCDGMHPRRWVLAAWVVLAVGVVLSSVGAATWYGAAEGRARDVFKTEAAYVEGAVATAIRRDMDFVSSQQSLFATFPQLTNARFASWYDGIGVRSRYPGSVGFAYVERVPAADLHRFATQLAADPPRGVSVPSPDRYRVFPAGARPAYCLTRLGVYSGHAEESTAATFDYCAPLGALSPFPAAFATASRLDQLVVAPPVAPYPGIVFAVAPVYSTAVAPTTPSAREADVRGWALGTFSGPLTLDAALDGVRHVALSLAFAGASGRSIPVATVGQPDTSGDFSTTSVVRLDGRWLVRVRAPADSPALGQSLALGIAGLGMTLLIFVFVRLLLRERRRALVLVEQRTGSLRHQALHDALTGLPNRALVVDRTEQMLARAQRSSLAVGALFIDLDNFKDVNDSFGHPSGDQLLRAVAVRLSTAVRPSDTVGRLGGDEFVVLVEGPSLDAGPEVVAERVLDVLAESFVLDDSGDVRLVVRASVGVAVGTRPSAEELLRDADVALYQAKRAGKGCFVVFRPEMQVAVQDRLALEMDLRAAFDAGELFLVYQPTFDLTNMRATGVEALARWTDPVRGEVPPVEFIAVAEESGLVVEIGRYVLDEACRQAVAWEQDGIVVPISVNVSGRQIESDGFVGDVRATLARTGLDPALLTLELTESVLMHDAEATRRRLGSLKSLGVKLAVDDFGTGYSSLAYLRQFPVDTLKIDQSFISGIASSPEARALIHTLVQLGKTLGIRTLAEGIEDESQLAQLKREKCDHGQGFLYSRPLSAEAIEELFNARGARSPEPRPPVIVEA